MTEMVQNYEVARNFFANYMHHPMWSNSSMVTPSISGLFNPNALRALYDFGIRSVVGMYFVYNVEETNSFKAITQELL